MLSIGTMGNGQGTYYVGLAREDYYLEGGEPPGQWIGEGAALLGLSGPGKNGQVEPEEFLKLFQGFDAHGKPLVQNAGQSEGYHRRKVGWDLTFSAPKSVSTLWAVADEETRHAIQDAHFEAVKSALKTMEEVAITRRDKDGQIKEAAQLVIATFEHGTSRAQDPHLHTHCIVLNLAVRADGTTGALESQQFFGWKMAVGALYQCEFARRLQGLGWEVERQKVAFRLPGVPEPLTDEFSKRRAEIESRLDANGKSSARAAAFAALDTRQVKEHIARDALFGGWRTVGESYGFSAREAQSLQTFAPTRGPAVEMAEALSLAISKISRDKSHFGERDLLRGMLEVERRAARKADSPNEAPQLSNEQRHALRHITEESGALALVSGMAGTGKTFLLEAARETWEAQGFKVIGAAVAGKAARGLEEGAGIASTTLARLALEWERGFEIAPSAEFVRKIERLHATWQIDGKTRRELLSPLDVPGSKTALEWQHATWQISSRQKEWLEKQIERREKYQLDDKTILVVDEAGMVGTHQMARLLAAAKEAGSKVVLVGDARQLQAVEVGGPFAALEKRLGAVQLSGIVRQKELWARQAVQDFAEGKAERALEAYQSRGLLSIAPDRARAKSALIAAWQEKGVAKPGENVIFAGTRGEARDLNHMAQEQRQRAGKLGFRSLKVGGETFHEKDRVLFTQNSRVLGVQNGTTGTIKAADKDRGTLLVRLDSGAETLVPCREYSHLSLGYALTTHKGQGLTTKNAFVLTGGIMADREIAYVQASRARETTRLFTERIEEWNPVTQQKEDATLRALGRTLSQSRQKDLAHDVGQGAVGPRAVGPGVQAEVRGFRVPSSSPGQSPAPRPALAPDDLSLSL